MSNGFYRQGCMAATTGVQRFTITTNHIMGHIYFFIDFNFNEKKQLYMRFDMYKASLST